MGEITVLVCSQEKDPSSLMLPTVACWNTSKDAFGRRLVRDWKDCPRVCDCRRPECNFLHPLFSLCLALCWFNSTTLGKICWGLFRVFSYSRTFSSFTSSTFRQGWRLSCVFCHIHKEHIKILSCKHCLYNRVDLPAPRYSEGANGSRH